MEVEDRYTQIYQRALERIIEREAKEITMSEDLKVLYVHKNTKHDLREFKNWLCRELDINGLSDDATIAYILEKITELKK